MSAKPEARAKPAAAERRKSGGLGSRLRAWRERGLLPDFPFGTDFTADELVIIRALRKLKDNVHHPLELAKMLWQSFGEEGEIPARYLARMGLEHAEPESMKMRLMRRLFIGNLG